MKFASTITLAFLLATPAAFAQQGQQAPEGMQQEQQACESDVYSLCGEAIPDTDRIATCLRAHWSKVSHACRSVMAEYAKQHHSRRERD